MTSIMSSKKENHEVAASLEKDAINQKVCPHMLRPDRCGLCLYEKHYKEMREELGRSEKGPVKTPGLK
jgi:hypothetical protein